MANDHLNYGNQPQPTLMAEDLAELMRGNRNRMNNMGSQGLMDQIPNPIPEMQAGAEGFGADVYDFGQYMGDQFNEGAEAIGGAAYNMQDKANDAAQFVSDGGLMDMYKKFFSGLK